MSLNKAIKLAVEKGWYKWKNPNVSLDDPIFDNGVMGFVGETKEGNNIDLIYSEQILLDPLFWQALGKALGWKQLVCKDCGTDCSDRYCSTLAHFEVIEEYKLIWHCFIDHIAEGKDIDSFFEELLK